MNDKKIKSYKDAGVDRELGDVFVEKIKGMLGGMDDPRVISGIGGFAAVYDMLDGRAIVACTDGVGTKLKLAQEFDCYESIAQDLVAMNVNDLICTGARPLFFLDYLAAGKLTPARDQRILKGIVAACRQSGMVLIGGETAEMPGVYATEDYDLAGFAVGEVTISEMIDGKQMRPGLDLIGIASSGPHSNGFGLLRKLLGPEDAEWAKMALVATKLYPSLILPLLNEFKGNVMGMAHITGGGMSNVPRMSDRLDYDLEMPSLSQVAPIFPWIAHRMDFQIKELYETFNMGVGFVLATDQGDAIMKYLAAKGERAWRLGKTVLGQGQVFLKSDMGQATLS